MPKSRRMYKAKKAFRKSYKKSIPKGMSMYNKPLIMKRSCIKFDATITGGPLSLNFTLSDLPNVTDITNLFDYYKIKGVKLKFMYLSNFNSTTQVPASALPMIHYCVDYDDSTSFASENQALERGNIHSRRLDKPFTYYIKPKANAELYKTATTTGYAIKGSQWIDTNDNTVPHFGFKSYIQSGAGAYVTPLGVLKVYATYYLGLRNPM